MKSYLKKLVKKIWSSSIIWNTAGYLFRKPGVIVLMYHRIGDNDSKFPGQDLKVFRQQMLWVKKHCQIISPEMYKTVVSYGRQKKPFVLITFDDGYRICYEQAYPVLEELSIPAIVFLATQPPDEGGLIWTEQVYWAVQQSLKKEIRLPWDSGKTLRLESDGEKQKAVKEIKDYLKKQANGDRIENLKKLYHCLAVPEVPDVERQMLTWEEVRDSTKYITYGGHTHSHPIMSRLDYQEIEHEISHCSNRILEETGKKPKYFAYPNGRSEDYNQDCIELLIKQGYELGFTTNEGLNNDGNFMEIKRIPTGAEKIEDFVWLLSHTNG